MEPVVLGLIIGLSSGFGPCFLVLVISILCQAGLPYSHFCKISALLTFFGGFVGLIVGTSIHVLNQDFTSGTKGFVVGTLCGFGIGAFIICCTFGIGFGPNGVSGGSFASSWQSSIGDVSAGSCFACKFLQISEFLNK